MNLLIGNFLQNGGRPLSEIVSVMVDVNFSAPMAAAPRKFGYVKQTNTRLQALDGFEFKLPSWEIEARDIRLKLA